MHNCFDDLQYVLLCPGSVSIVIQNITERLFAIYYVQAKLCIVHFELCIEKR